MPNPAHHAAVTALNGKMYLFGGFDLPTAGPPGWNPVNDAWEYDPASDGWRALAAMPTPRGGGVAAVVGGEIYAIRGAGPQPPASAAGNPRRRRRSAGRQIPGGVSRVRGLRSGERHLVAAALHASASARVHHGRLG